MSVLVFKYGAGRKGGEATERAKNKFASAGGGERSGTGCGRASVVARGLPEVLVDVPRIHLIWGCDSNSSSRRNVPLSWACTFYSLRNVKT